MRYCIDRVFFHNCMKGYFMKKQLLTGVVLATGLLFFGLQADVSSGGGMKEIYRNWTKGKIKANNANIEDVFNFDEIELSKCTKILLKDSIANNEKLKKAMKTDEATADSSTLKTVEQNKKMINSSREKIKKAFLLCMKNANEENEKVVLQSAQKTKEAVEDYEKKIGKKSKKAVKKQSAKKPGKVVKKKLKK